MAMRAKGRASESHRHTNFNDFSDNTPGGGLRRISALLLLQTFEPFAFSFGEFSILIIEVVILFVFVI
jgi:hypothetical protein